MGEIAGTNDPKVAELLEARADPEARSHHEKLMARAEALRLDSLGYKYQSGGFGSAMLSLVYPEAGVLEGWERATGDNVYSSGEGWVARLQSGIERFRGVMKVVGEVLGAVSTAAAAFAAVSAAVAAILSWTVVGGAVAGAIAAGALKVSVVTGLAKAVLSGIDALLSIVQIVINVARARSSDDPIERARICQQMKKESGDFGNSLTDTVMEVAGAATGGVGRAAGKGVKAGVQAAKKVGVRTTMGKAWKQGVKSVKGVGPALSRGMKQLSRKAARLKNVAAMRRLLRIRAKAKIPGTRVWVGRQKAAYESAVEAGLSDLRAQVLAMALGGPGAVGKGTAKGLVGAGGGAGTAAAKGRDVEKAKAGSGPSAGMPGEGPPVNFTYRKVAYWPSVLERMGAVRQDMHTASTRMKGHYDAASEDAGDKKKAIVELMGAPARTGTRLRMAGGKQKADAEAGKAKSKEASEQADKALTKQKETGEKAKEAEGEGKAAKEKAAEADAGVKGAPKPDESLWERAKRWAYENTLGRVFRGLATVQKAITDFVLKLALAAAGLDADDMDLAGMKQEADKEAEADEQAKEDAAESEQQGDTVDARIKELKKTGTNQEQAAIQGMVDSGDYIDALDGYDQAMAQEQDHGTNYIAQATDSVAAEADAPLVTPAYIQPIVDGAAFLTAELNDFPDRLQASAGSAVETLRGSLASQGLPAGPGVELGQAVVEAAVGAASKEVGRIATDAQAVATGARSLVGTDWFIVAEERYGAAMDALGQEYEGVVAGAIEGIAGAFGAITGAYANAARDMRDREAGDETAPAAVPAAGSPEE